MRRVFLGVLFGMLLMSMTDHWKMPESGASESLNAAQPGGYDKVKAKGIQDMIRQSVAD